jgi:hypothetical protein
MVLAGIGTDAGNLKVINADQKIEQSPDAIS